MLFELITFKHFCIRKKWLEIFQFFVNLLFFNSIQVFNIKYEILL
jgi:hypothetical protein